MRDVQLSLRDTLQYVLSSEIPSQHKAVLIEVLTQALREQSDAHAREQSAHRAGAQWQTQELRELESFLEGKTAKSWQHADELAMHLAAQLHRSLDDVRAKAVELGFGGCIDYRRAFLTQAKEVE